MNTRYKEVFIDTTLYSMLFLLLSSPSTVKMVRPLFKGFENRMIIHTFVFALVYLAIQKVLRRI